MLIINATTPMLMAKRQSCALRLIAPSTPISAALNQERHRSRCRGRGCLSMGAFESHGLPLPGGIQAILPARQSSDLDQDVIAHKRDDRFSQAAFTVMDGGSAHAHSRCASEGWGTLCGSTEPFRRNW